MIAWIIGIITLVLLFFVIWRKVSKAFRERCEEPKYLFLKSLGVTLASPHPPVQPHLPQENNHGHNHS